MIEDQMFDGITDLMDMSFSKFQEIVMDREAWHAVVHGSQRLSDLNELNRTDKDRSPLISLNILSLF